MPNRTLIHRPLSRVLLAALLAPVGAALSAEPFVDAEGHRVVLEAGHASLQRWLLPAAAPAPADNGLTPERAALGKMLFFDPRLSGTGQSTCASCHMPERGWSDGFPRSIRLMGKEMARASPTIVNSGYNTVQLWDGRSATLEHQALNGISPNGSMNAGADKPVEGVGNLLKIPGYLEAFERAYPGEGINAKTVARAIASFERTVVSRNSPFDRWVSGDAAALTPSQQLGLRLFLDPQKGNCSGCHAAPNFTDNGFHNIGLASAAGPNADPGRHKQRPVAAMKGAFKTPTLRDVSLTAPYFHDGSARTLAEVLEHYVAGGRAVENLSPNMKPLALDAEEKAALVDFLRSLTTPHEVFQYPVLPR